MARKLLSIILVTASLCAFTNDVFSCGGCTYPTTPSLTGPGNGATNQSIDGVTLTWNDCWYETSYKVYMKKSSDSTYGLLVTLPAGTTQYTTDALEPGTAYNWKVRALNGCGSHTSSVWSFTTYAVLYVNHGAVGNDDGSSWSDAFLYLQDALDEAASGGEIWVAKGTYKPDEGTGRTSGDRTESFEIGEDVNVYGGFYGNEAYRSDRDPQSNKTILSGNIDTDGDLDSLHVVIADSEAIVDGVIIEGGGVGVLCASNNDPTITNCVISGNRDGIACEPSASPDILANDICNNTDNGIITIMATPTVKNNRIYDNSFGILCTASSTVTIENNTFVRNTCSGIESNGCLAPTISNCLFWDNYDDLVDCTATNSHSKDDGDYFPYFTDADANDFHLESWSPCIDAGSGTFTNEPDYPSGALNIGAYGNTSEAAVASADSDEDGLPDDWEEEFLGGTSQDDDDDTEDADGLTNLEEYQLGTRPNLEDTDGDGMKDGWEVDYGLDPLDTSDADGDEDNDGKTNWQEHESGSNPSVSDVVTVTGTIQAAINSCTEDWDVVEIPAGTYDGEGNRDIDFGGNKITVRSTDPDNPSVVANTVIDCESLGRAFYFHSGEGLESVISGLTIINGYEPSSGGGAILCENGSSPTIEKCVLRYNFADQGGAIYNSSSMPIVVGCEFAENEADNDGAAVYNEASDAIFVNSVFVENIAYNSDGGALYNDSSSNPKLTNCTVAGNAAESGDGGGIYGETDSTPILVNCILWGNTDFGGIILPEYFQSDCATGFGGSCYTDWEIADYAGAGGSSSWSTAGGILSQTVDFGDSTDDKLGTYAYYEQGGSWDNYRVSTIIRTGSTDNGAIGMMFRYQHDETEGNRDYYRFSWNKTESYRRLEKCIDGTFNILAEDQVPYVQDKYYEIEIVADGSTLEVYVDDSLVLSAEDTDKISTGTIAFYCWQNSAASFDNVVVTHPLRTGEGEYAQIYGGSPQVSSSCIQDDNPLDASIPFYSDGPGNIDDDPKLKSLLGLVAYWKFDEGSGTEAEDSAGYADGTINNATWTTGQYGGALEFDGTTGYVEVTDDDRLDLPKAVTISAWINPSSSNDERFQRIVAAPSEFTNSYVLCYRASDNKVILCRDGDTSLGRSADGITEGSWQHVVAGYDHSDHPFIYINGVKQALGRNYGAGRNSGHLTIGSRQGATGYYFGGKLDEVMIFNRMLSDSEIGDLHQLGLASVKDNLELSVTSPCIDSGDDGAVEIDVTKYDYLSSELVSHWKLDEGTGTQALDSVGGCDGTVNGTLQWVTGRFKGALGFDGSTNYVDVSDDDLLDIDGAVSISVWINPDSSTSETWQRIVVSPDGFSNPYVLCYKAYDQTVILARNGQNSLTRYAGGIQTENWNHIAAGYDSDNEPFIHINGVPKSLTTGGGAALVSGNFRIGGRQDTACRFKGKIDDAMVYSRVLLASEIQTLHAIGLKDISLDNTNDISGNDRLLDGDDDGAANIDMGSHEFDYDTWLSNGRVSYWKFDENTSYDTEDSSSDNDGVIYGAAWTVGKFGSGLAFDGTNDYVDVGTDASLSDIRDNFTIMFWAKPTATHGIDEESTGGTAGTSGQKYAIGPRQGNTQWGSGHAGVGVSVGTNGISVYEHAENYLPALLVWEGTITELSHVAVVYTDNKPRLYVNGELKRTGLQSSNIIHAMPFHVGGLPSYDEYYQGVLDELIIYDRALSAREVEYLAGNRAPVLAIVGDKNVVEGRLLSFVLDATDIDGDALTFSAGDLPNGAQLDGSTFRWRPEIGDADTYEVTFTVSDGELTDSETIDIEVVEEGLAGYWSFDEGAGDVAYGSMSGCYARVAGASWVPGKYGNALDFDGVGDYVSIADLDDFDNATVDMTIAMWIKPGNIEGSSYQMFLDKIYAHSEQTKIRGFSFGAWQDTELISFSMKSDTWLQVYGETVLENNKWYFVAVTYDGSKYYTGVKLYVNGAAETVYPYNDHYGVSDDDISNDIYAQIGAREGSNYPFDGRIDEVMIFDRELDISEIKDVCDSGLDEFAAADMPIRYWKFDELSGNRAHDVFADCNDGEIFGVTRGQGRIGQALKLDGTDDYVELPSGFDDFTSGLTIAVWVYPTKENNGYARFIDFGENGSADDNILFNRNGTNSLDFSVYNGGTNGGTIIASSAIELNKWQHFVATLDSSGNAKIYKNGSQTPIAAGTTAVPANVTRDKNYIGKSNWPVDGLYEGMIDEVMIFDRELSSTEVEGLYGEGLGGLSGSNPISYWAFEETSGNVCEDSTGDNDGIIKTIPWTQGQVGNALIFDGADDYVVVGTDSSLSDITNDFTIMFWAEPTAEHENDTQSSGGQAGTSGQKYAIGPHEGNTVWGDGHAGAGVSVGTDGISVYEHASGHMPPLLVWNGAVSGMTHIAVVFNSGQPSLYVDGDYKCTGYDSTKSYVHVLPGHIGGHDYGDFEGKMDEVLIFDQALYVTEIEDIYDNGIAGVDARTGLGSDPLDDLVSYWKFDGDAYDSVGDSDGELKGDLNTTGWTDGQVEGALNLSTDNDYVVLEDMDGAYYSFSFWAKFIDDSPDNERIISFGEGDGEEIDVIISRDSDTKLAYQNDSLIVSSEPGFVVADEWHHYAIVQIVEGDDSKVLFYRDGVQYGPVKIVEDKTVTADSWSNCYIGSSGSGNYFTGILDELRIYERSLSDSEVETLANNRNHPVLTSIGDRTVETGDLITFSLYASDEDDDEVEFTVDNLPDGAYFNGRAFSWIPRPDQEGDYRMTFVASDGLYEDVETIRITVATDTGDPVGVTKAVSGILGGDLSLQVDPFTGSLSYSIPIALPPARQGTEPSLSLNYTGGGNSWCGFGWSLAGGGAIQRNTKDGMPVNSSHTGYDDSYSFTASFSTVNSELVRTVDGASIDEYRAELEQAFLKYEFYKAESGGIPENTWVVTDKSGNKFYFGAMDGEDTETVGILMQHPQFTTASSCDQTFLWALAKIRDINGNITYFDYVVDEGQIYFKSVRYNASDQTLAIDATHQVEFVLDDRPDTSISYGTGCRTETNKRLSEIIVKIVPDPGEPETFDLVRRYKLDYMISDTSKRSLLRGVTLFGTDNETSLPPVTFEYQECPFEFGPTQDWGPIDNQGYTDDNADGRKWNSTSGTGSDKATFAELLDINGDGLPDRVMRIRNSPYDIFKVQFNTGYGFETDENDNPITRDWGPVKSQGHQTDSQWGSIQDIDGDGDAIVLLMDLNGDGLPDRVMQDDGGFTASVPSVLKVQFNTGFGFESDVTEWTNLDNQGDAENGWNGVLGADGDSTDTFVMMSDLNSDGLPDRVMRNDADPDDSFYVQFNQFKDGSNSFSNKIPWGPLDAQGDTGTEWNSPNARSGSYNIVSLLDINGDGLPDRVMRKKNSPYTVFVVQFNTGYGFEEDSSNDPVVYDWGPLFNQGHDTDAKWGSLQSLDGDGDGDAFVMLFDISADGLPDRVLRNDVTNFSGPENVFKVQLNTGTGFESVARLWRGIDSQGQTTDKGWNSPYGVDSDGSVAMLLDINGDGLPDRVMRHKTSTGYKAPNNGLKVQLNKGPVPDLLKRVNGRLGGSAEVNYTPSTRYDNHDCTGKSMLAFPIQTVSSLMVDDGFGTRSTTTYDYARGYFDTKRREFRGFGKVQITDPCGTRTVMYFHQGGGYDDTDNGEFEDNVDKNGDPQIAKKGMPYLIEVYGSDGLLYNRTVHKVVQDNIAVGNEPDRYFAYVAQTINMDYEGLEKYRARAKESWYDTSTGNITQVANYGEVINVDIANHIFTDLTEYADGRKDYTHYTHTEYATFATNSDIINKVERVWTSRDSDGDEILGEKIFSFDENCDYTEERGNVTTTKVWLDTKGSYDIIAVGSNYFDISGEHAAEFTTGQIRVSSSSGNDRDYTISSASNISGNTHIITSETPPDSTVDGKLQLLSTSYVSTTAEYDYYGNKDKTTNVAGISTTVTYDTTYKAFAVQSSTGTTLAFTTSSTYDERSGLVLTTQDVMGIKTENIYDELFRLTDIYIGTSPGDDPDLWVTNVEYNIGGIEDGQISHNFIRQRFEGYESYIYNDGFGRVIQTRTKAEPGAEGEFRAVDACYDLRGKNYFTTDPFFSDGAGFSLWDENKSGVFTTYDPVGRPVTVESTDDDGEDSPMGTAYTYYKDGIDQWTQVGIDPMGTILKKSFDARGNVIRMTEVIGEEGGDDDILTNYYYDEFGHLIETVDDVGNTISASYDYAGRKLKTDDPDMGIWTYKYDDAGRLTEQIDAIGNKVTLTYESDHGRLWKNEIYDDTPTKVTTIEYTYDNYDTGEGVYNHGDTDYKGHKGLLYRVTKIDEATSTIVSERRFGYDERGLQNITGQYIYKDSTGTWYDTESTYDDAGRITTIAYPDGISIIRYAYESTTGYLEQVYTQAGDGTDGAKTFYQPQGFDAFGQPIGVAYGNGVSTQYEYYEYSRRLKRIHTYDSTSSLMDLTYTFDKAANIKSMVDHIYTGGASSTLSDIQYDDLYRLTSLHYVGEDRTTTLEYDDLGNITTNADLAGGATYTYGSSGAGPHAVTSLSYTGGSRSYSYDDNGNMTSRQTATTIQTLTYDEEDRLVQVTDTGTLNVKYGYDYDGTRLWKKDVTNSRTQLWIGGIYEEKYDPISDDMLKLAHVYAGGTLVATFQPLGTYSNLIKNTPVLAQTYHAGKWAAATFFGNGRAPLSIMGFGILAGLALGLVYSKRRLAIIYGLTDGWLSRAFWMRDPFRQIILLMVMAAMLTGVFPQVAYAGTPSARPVFYYYHGDHLGSSSIMTDGDGDVVQHYGYYAFGKERYKKETQAFAVTNRYTGQQIDEDTGLYYYSSRYYDPELARFTQPDTVVPSANTSQALNRYAYVANNPLKFTDPAGHGWFSNLWKKVRGWIGTIVTVALCIIAPWGSGFWATLAYAAIGSAVGTAVNGGTFKSFAIGMGIGLAAGTIANALGGWLGGGAEAWKTFAQGDLIGMALSGALAGTTAGAISSCVYGVNVGKGMLSGLYSGLAGTAVAAATATVISFGANVIKELTGSLSARYSAKAHLTYRTTDGKLHKVTIRKATDLVFEILKTKYSGLKIKFFEYVGHGFDDGSGLAIGEGGFVVGQGDRRFGEYGFDRLESAIKQTFTPDARIELEACYSAYGSNSIAHQFHRTLPNATVIGYSGPVQPVPMIFVNEAWRGRFIFSTKEVALRNHR